MRLFVALTVPSGVAASITDWRHCFSALPVRWLPEGHLHVTIIPPWDEVDELPVIESLREAEGSIGSVSLRFDRVRLAPNPRDPRLIWADAVPPPTLLQLKQHLERSLDMDPDRRPFRMHLTLARFTPDQFAAFPDRNLSETISWSGTFNTFALVRSDFFPSGIEYTILSTHQC